MTEDMLNNNFYTSLWNADFIEIEGMIFRADNWKRAHSNFAALMKKKIPPSDIEKELNHVHLDVFVDSRPIDFAIQLQFAHKLRERWLKQLENRYPDKACVIEIEELAPYQVSLYLYCRRAGKSH